MRPFSLAQDPWWDGAHGDPAQDARGDAPHPVPHISSPLLLFPGEAASGVGICCLPPILAG